ncbi:hypothetical protein QBC37DRAFT_403375, partial [Rhypophila decipiens]
DRGGSPEPGIGVQGVGREGLIVQEGSHGWMVFQRRRIPFVDWKVKPGPEGNLKRLEVRAIFTYEADARNAAASLSNASVSFSPHGEVKIDVELRTSVKLWISNPVYHLIEEQINAFHWQASWERAGIDVAVWTFRSGSNMIKIEGVDNTGVGCAKSALQEILRGRVASHQGKDLWHPGFAFRTGEISRWVKLIQGQCHVQIKEDSSKSQLRIIGSEKGSCGHRYCKDCFTTMARAAGSSTATCELSISCVATGAGQPCKKLFSLDELIAHLPRPEFEGILRASFNSLIRRRPEQYGHCPTPGCENIFRSTSVTKTPPRTETFTCLGCLEPNCSNCHSPHIGMSCGDYKEKMAGRANALRRAKEELGIKDCPHCTAPIEKVAGCNHITCERGCGTHICWTCLEHFPTSKKCYDHMWAVHGRIHDEGAEPVPQELQAAAPVQAVLVQDDEDNALLDGVGIPHPEDRQILLNRAIIRELEQPAAFI